jgi:hypothetical protein
VRIRACIDQDHPAKLKCHRTLPFLIVKQPDAPAPATGQPIFGRPVAHVVSYRIRRVEAERCLVYTSPLQYALNTSPSRKASKAVSQESQQGSSGCLRERAGRVCAACCSLTHFDGGIT